RGGGQPERGHSVSCPIGPTPDSQNTRDCMIAVHQLPVRIVFFCGSPKEGLQQGPRGSGGGGRGGGRREPGVLETRASLIIVCDLTIVSSRDDQARGFVYHPRGYSVFSVPDPLVFVVPDALLVVISVFGVSGC
ncbi:unnamed protein product, partial [Pylaiella littoralis]